MTTHQCRSVKNKKLFDTRGPAVTAQRSLIVGGLNRKESPPRLPQKRRGTVSLIRARKSRSPVAEADELDRQRAEQDWLTEATKLQSVLPRRWPLVLTRMQSRSMIVSVCVKNVSQPRLRREAAEEAARVGAESLAVLECRCARRRTHL